MHLQVDTLGERGPAVVCTHGLGDDATTWSAVAEGLSAEARVTTWDLRGHGRSDVGDRHDRDVALDDVAGVVAAAGAPVHLVGHSLGGYLSLVLALRDPSTVLTLTMIASGPGFRDATARERWNAYVVEQADRFPIEPRVAGLATQRDGFAMEHLASLAIPLLVVVGERDTRFHAGAEHLASRVPGATLVRVPDAGHHAHRSHPAVVVAALRAHLGLG